MRSWKGRCAVRRRVERRAGWAAVRDDSRLRVRETDGEEAITEEIIAKEYQISHTMLSISSLRGLTTLIHVFHHIPERDGHGRIELNIIHVGPRRRWNRRSADSKHSSPAKWWIEFFVAVGPCCKRLR